MVYQDILKFRTTGRGTLEITADVEAVLRKAKIRCGLCNIFTQHTSASLLLCENADPDVRSDIETFLSDLVKDGDVRFRHDTEGPDDMSAHIRSILTEAGLTLPVNEGRLALGTWQGVYLYEHRYSPCQRQVVVTVYGE